MWRGKTPSKLAPRANNTTVTPLCRTRMRRQRPIITRAIRRPCNRQVMLPQWELNHSSAARGGLSAETRAVLDMVVRSSPLAWALRWGARPSARQ